MWYVDDHLAKLLTDRRRCLFVQQMGYPVENESGGSVLGVLAWPSWQGRRLLAGLGRQLVALGSRLERYDAPQPSLR